MHRQRGGFTIGSSRATIAFGGLTVTLPVEVVPSFFFPLFRRSGVAEQPCESFDGVSVDAPAKSAAIPERMRFRTFVNGEMPARPRHRNIQMLQELLEAGIVIHFRGVPHESIDGAAGRRSQIPEHGRVEFQSLRVANLEDARCLESGVKASALYLVKHEDCAA